MPCFSALVGKRDVQPNKGSPSWSVCNASVEPPVASPPSSTSPVVDVEQAENHVRELRAFIEKHRFLLDRHVVDFYIADPPPLRASDDGISLERDGCWHIRGVHYFPHSCEQLNEIELLKLPLLRGIEIPSTWPASLREFMQTAHDISLPSDMTDEIKPLDVPASIKNGTKDKKIHECPRHSATAVVDVGAGKGYLGQLIRTQNAELPVLGLEGSEANTAAAQCREAKRTGTAQLDRYSLTTQPNTVALRLGPGAESAVISAVDERKEMHGRQIALVGLHTCQIEVGSLSELPIWCVKARPLIDLVACCYNLLSIADKRPDLGGALALHSKATPQSLLGFPLCPEAALPVSRYALMWACQAPARWTADASSLDETQIELRNIHERALLQTMFAKHNLCTPGAKPVSLGPRPASAATFAAFVTSSLTKLKLPPLSAAEIEGLERTGEKRRKELCVWWALKGCLARVLESLILWDRVLFMRRAGASVRLLPLFDALVSPRQHVIIAWRSQNR